MDKPRGDDSGAQALAAEAAPAMEPAFRRLFEEAPGLFLVLDAGLRIVAVSNSYLAATMAERDAILGRGVFDVFPDNPEDAGADGVRNLRASLERVIEQRMPDVMAVQKYDIRRPESEGGGFEVRWWSPLNSPLLDADGRLEYIVHRVEDVTEFVRLKETEAEQSALASELRERGDLMEAEIIQRARELQQTNEQLREANAAKTSFLSRMSHELRSPLTAILGFAALLANAELDAKYREHLRHIRAAGAHLASLIDEVLDLSRIEAGTISVSPEALAVKPIIDEAIDLMRPIAEAHDVVLQPAEYSLGSGYVLADGQRLKQVVINLLSNAIKYNRPNGEVHVVAAREDSGPVRIAVSDTGAGIDEQSLEKMFEPFERLGAATSGIEGTGLGLAISRSLVEAMGGSVTVESELGVGTTLTLELLPGDAAAITAAASEGETPPTVRPYPRPVKLLYVEDTVANVRLIEGILEFRPSVQLIPAMLGQLGFELAQEHHPSLILLDLHLPDLPGEEVLRLLRADPRTCKTPVVILSADATRPREPLLAAGAQAYLVKPIGIARILEVLDQFLAE